MADHEWSKDYSERGIERDTWACINVGDKTLVKKALLNLALSGVPALVSRDPRDPKLYHLAVQGGFAGSTIAWVVALRDQPFGEVTCPPDHLPGQHPQATHTIEEATDD